MPQRRRIESRVKRAVFWAVPVALLACVEPRDPPVGSQPEIIPSASPSSAPPPARSDCPRYSAGSQTGTIEDKAISEASGLAVSRQNPGVLWTHNDSGGHARVFALTTDGRNLGSYALKHARARDWEDISIGPGPEPGTWYLYVGDIGGNSRPRKKVVVYRVLEPRVKSEQKAKQRKLDEVDELELRYPKGGAHDAETLMVDPSTSDLYLVTKQAHGRAAVFVARAPQSQKSHNQLEEVATLRLPMGPPGALLITGGDIAADGSAIVIRTYSRAYLWPWKARQSIAEALQAEPCRIPLRPEPQGEAIAFTATADAYFTVSEGKHPPLYRYARQR